MVFDNSGKTSIWAQDRGSDKRLQNIAQREASQLARHAKNDYGDQIKMNAVSL